VCGLQLHSAEQRNREQTYDQVTEATTAPDSAI
jgi:hypothetical protein